MLIIVFGLAASGKTYIGESIQEYFGFHHEDADHWLSKEMRQFIHEKKLFTLDMLESFTSTIIANIDSLRKTHKNLVVSQALYRQKNRDTIIDYYAGKEDLLFIQVEAEEPVIYNRLINRKDSITPAYAASMREFFEPMQNAKIINNNQTGSENILSQLNQILS